MSSLVSRVQATMLSLPGMMLSIGIDVVTGFAQGILAAIPSAVSAAMQLGSSVETGVRSSLDMHSPSKKMRSLGLNASGSFGGGIDAGTPKVKASVYEMVAPPTPRQLMASSSSTSRASDGSGRSVTFHIASGAIVISGDTSDPQGIKRGILEAFEEVALEFGTA